MLLEAIVEISSCPAFCLMTIASHFFNLKALLQNDEVYSTIMLTERGEHFSLEALSKGRRGIIVADSSFLTLYRSTVQQTCQVSD